MHEVQRLSGLLKQPIVLKIPPSASPLTSNTRGSGELPTFILKEKSQAGFKQLKGELPHNVNKGCEEGFSPKAGLSRDVTGMEEA